MIERYIHWNEDIGEYQLKCVAYTGNNMKKRQSDINEIQEKEMLVRTCPYLQYSGSAKKPRSRCSNVPRPTRHH